MKLLPDLLCVLVGATVIVVAETRRRSSCWVLSRRGDGDAAEAERVTMGYGDGW